MPPQPSTFTTSLVGLSIAQNSRFRKMFEHMTHNADLGTTILPNIPSDSTPLDTIELCWEKAVDMHDFLGTIEQWNIAKKGGDLHMANYNNDGFKCWNDEKTGCNARECKEPKDQQQIDRNMKIFQDKKKNGEIKPKSRGGYRQTNDKRKREKGRDQYCRKQWSQVGMTRLMEHYM